MTAAGEPVAAALDDDLRDAYLARLGLPAEPPSAAALAALHCRHAERIPYETLWIHGGEPWGTDPLEAAGAMIPPPLHLAPPPRHRHPRDVRVLPKSRDFH